MSKSNHQEKNNSTGLRTWVIINRANIKHNYQAFRRLIGPKTQLMAVAKSNAYGHGLTDFSRTLSFLGVDGIAVDSLVEALSLRKAGIHKPLLVLGYTLPKRFREAAKFDVNVTISSWENFKALSNRTESKPLRIHLKIDSGMHRQGFLPEDAGKLLRQCLRLNRSITIAGLYTHFATASRSDIQQQLKRFMVVDDLFRQAGLAHLRHAANTAATLIHPSSRLDLVRIGIGLYGYYPFYKLKFKQRANFFPLLKPVLTWKTVISEIKELPQGSKIGYDFTETLKRWSRVAICPVGYWHGYPRSLSGRAHVLVKGKRAKVLGRISMDMITVDVTSLPDARAGEEVILLGSDRGLAVSADDLAKIAGTINYEIITRLNPLMKRIYL